MAVSLSLAIKQNSQNIANNTSNVTVDVTIRWTYGSWNAYPQCNGSITIDGIAYEFSGKRFNEDHTQSGSEVVMSKTVDVAHNSDGSKTLNCSAIFYVYLNTTNSTSCSGSKVLTTIARASQPSLVTWPETTNDVGDFGETFSIHMNRKSDAFTHTVRYEYGNRSGTIATSVGTGTTWAIPLEFINDIPNATSGSGRIYVDTYNGSTLVGTKYTGFTATVPASVKPSLSVTLDDTTGVDDIYGSPVKGLSKIKITPSVTLAYSSPIASYTITANGVTYNTAPATTGVLSKAGDSVVTVTVRDKRGRTATWSYTMSVQDYTHPNVSKLSVKRCDEDGTPNERGSYAMVTFSAAVTSLNSKNTADYVLRYKKTSVTSWTSVGLTSVRNNYTVTDSTYIFAADGNNSYDVELTAMDAHGTATRATSISTAFTLINFHEDGTGIAFGKVSEGGNTLEIAFDTVFYGAVRGAIFDAIYPVGSIYLAYNHTDPSTLFGGTWVRIENRFLWATTPGGTIGQTGGEQTVTLTIDEIPSHSHGSVYSGMVSGTKNTAWLSSGGSNMAYGALYKGGGEAHNNMPPYIQVSAWRRTA